MASLEIKLLSSFQVTLNGRTVTDFATDKVRALFAYLVVEHTCPHRRESLAALLWPEQPDKRARQNLRQALSNLRQVLGDHENDQPFLLIDRNDIQLNPQADVRLDAAEFSALGAACANHRHQQISSCLPCLQRLKTMIDLYQGDFLTGFLPDNSVSFEEWTLLKREWLHGQAIEALTLLADYAEKRGDYAAARRYAQQQVQLEPWREEAHRQLIRLLAQNGQRSAALAQYAACRRALAQELGVPPTTETEHLYQKIRRTDLPAADPPTTSLPLAPTPFVGRAVERAELSEMLANPDCRLITLIGPGGVGKSRLALQVAEEHRGLYADGLFWVDLSVLQNSDQIVPTLAQILGLALHGQESPQRQLLNYLHPKWLLLVLDSAEHLPELAIAAESLLNEAPHLTLFVTSRQRLALREEWVYEVGGLEYPETAVTEQTSQHEAITFFLQQVQRTQRHFRPTATDFAALGDICRFVEGMPLALELAAAWIPERSCAAVAQELAAGLDMLTSSLRNAPKRQHSIRATFAHSWALLTQAERYGFAQLSLFQGGFEAAAAVQVAAVDSSMLGSLLNKSLVRCGGNGRYQLHTLIRQFATEKLSELDNLDATAARHAAYYTLFLAAYESALKGAGQENALIAIDQELANIRQAWQWAVAHLDTDGQAARTILHNMLESLNQYYCLRSWYHEGTAVFNQAITTLQKATNGQDDLLLGKLLARQARCLEFTAPAAEAYAFYQQSLTLFRNVDAVDETALPLYGLGYMTHLQGEYETARHYFMDSLACYKKIGDSWGIATALSGLCLSLRRQGSYTEARQAGEQSLTIRRALGDQRGIASSQNNLGLILCALGEYDAAETALLESAAICRAIKHTVGTANAYTSLIHVSLRRGNHVEALRFQEEALHLFQQVGDLWGVAIAYNNLGQIMLESGKANEACALFSKGVVVYRQVNIQAGLANTLNNLGQASFVLGDVLAAARYFCEALEIALSIGDVPIALEIITRTAVLWQQHEKTSRPLVLMAFALRQPELLAETRQTAAVENAKLHTKFSPEAVSAAEKEAAALDLPSIAAEARLALQDLTAGIVK